MSRLSWTVAMLVAAAVAALYAYLVRQPERNAEVATVEIEAPLDATPEAPPDEVPVEPPSRLMVKRLPDNPAIDAQLPEACPLTAVEYRYGNLMTNVLVERFDDNSTARRVVVGRRRIQVNTDGAPNSYHSRVIKADDESVGALNIICNARVKIFKKDGAARKPVACRMGGGSVSEEYAKAYEELRSKNWEDTESGYSVQFDWSILGREAQARSDGAYAPCVRDDGFFVAKTRLRLRSSTNECDASIYPDSTTTSAFVLPINWFAGYRKKSADGPERFSNFRSGDLVVAHRPGAPSRPPVWIYGVIGDAGPFNKLGEASVAFHRLLRQSVADVRTYRAALRLDTDALKPSEIDFLVFEGSAGELRRDYSPANVRKVGERRFAAWMHGALDKAQSRFLACAKKLDLLPPVVPPPPS